MRESVENTAIRSSDTYKINVGGIGSSRDNAKVTWIKTVKKNEDS